MGPTLFLADHEEQAIKSSEILFLSPFIPGSKTFQNEWNELKNVIVWHVMQWNKELVHYSEPSKFEFVFYATKYGGI